jgi:hypothetical protein
VTEIGAFVRDEVLAGFVGEVLPSEHVDSALAFWGHHRKKRGLIHGITAMSAGVAGHQDFTTAAET